MRTQIVEQIEFFSEAELESLEFVPEELEAIEAERVPDLDSISFEDIAKELEAYFEGGVEGVRLEMNGPPHLPPELWSRILQHRTATLLTARIRNLQNQRTQAIQAHNAALVVQLNQRIALLTNQRAAILQRLG